MKAYETFATVEPQGDVRLIGVPFAPGTEVEVTISRKRQSAEEFAQSWNRVCGQLRKLAPTESITDDEIRQEINDYRAGR
jgi:hypothetical protein